MSGTTRLGVNVDHVATLRQARGTKTPDPVAAAVAAELAGADMITVHLREDRRHIQDRDVRVLREVVSTRLNLEMAVTDEMLAIALQVQPDLVTLVPERREERTTEGGLDCTASDERIERVVRELKAAGIPTSLFIDADTQQVRAAQATGADMIELHTGDYALATSSKLQRRELARIRVAAANGRASGLQIAAGHGLDYRNVGEIARIGEIEELNIGHSIVGRAVLVGFDRAVREMIAAMRVGEAS